MKLRSRLAAVGAATAVALGGLIAAPVATVTPNSTPSAVAQAGECSAPGICGRIKNTGRVPIRLIQGWPSTYGVHLPAGRVSSDWHRDTDGVYAYTGQRIEICMPFGFCRTITGPASFKVQDSFWTYTARVK